MALDDTKWVWSREAKRLGGGARAIALIILKPGVWHIAVLGTPKVSSQLFSPPLTLAVGEVLSRDWSQKPRLARPLAHPHVPHSHLDRCLSFTTLLTISYFWSVASLLSLPNSTHSLYSNSSLPNPPNENTTPSIQRSSQRPRPGGWMVLHAMRDLPDIQGLSQAKPDASEQFFSALPFEIRVITREFSLPGPRAIQYDLT
jgi:hypothetical protein